ncbi:MAG TPA: hypothetical protein VFY93_02335 [Planctomycetota bacterium]|nr:hypothetical protein [Planctomycetota bacterium]
MWPDIPCLPDGTTAGQLLDQIRDKARRELRPGPLLNRVLTAVEACRNAQCHFTAVPPPEPDHCQWVILARISAGESQWVPCAEELEHGI